MDLLVTKQKQLICGDKSYKCAIGRSGFVPEESKEEGDGATPTGKFLIRKVFYRADKVSRPVVSNVPVQEITPYDGWCDDPRDPFYNQHVRLPYQASHELLWRSDESYDIIVVVGHNDSPPVPKHGSAIFLHVARKNYTPTEGCVALSTEDLLKILQEITEKSYLCIL